jgi:hypothetical protein
MSARQKLTAAQIEFAREISRRRRALYRSIKMIPTNAELARELGCTERWLAKIISEKVRRISPQVVPRETTGETISS